MNTVGRPGSALLRRNWIDDVVAGIPPHARERALRWRDSREQDHYRELLNDGWPEHPLPSAQPERRYPRGRASEAAARANRELSELRDYAPLQLVGHIDEHLGVEHRLLAWIPHHMRKRALRWRDRRVKWHYRELRRGGWPKNPVSSSNPEQIFARGRSTEAAAFANRELSALNALVSPLLLRHVGDGLDADDVQVRASAKALAARPAASPLPSQLALRRLERIAGVQIPGQHEQARWLRASDPGWWKRQIQREIRHRTEALWAIVAPTAVKWVSPDGLTNYRKCQDAQTSWLASHCIEDQHGIRVGLDVLAEGREGRRYAELLARTAGIAKLAKDQAMTPALITITCPSRMHATTSAGRDQRRRPNPKYDQTSVRESHQWAMSRWAKWRSALKRRGIEVFWCIGVQPHLDGTPHYHAMIWAAESDWAEIRRLAIHYWWDCEPDPDASVDRRIRIDPVKGGHGGAVAYLARVVAYVARTVNGPDATEAEHATAWASRHNIRRYRTSETHSTIWRYLRRRDLDVTPMGNDAIAAQAAARGNPEADRRPDYAEFLRRRQAAGLTVAYVEQQNQYAETVKRPVGVKNAAGLQIVPSRKWTIVPKRQALSPRTVIQEEPRAGRSGPPESLNQALERLLAQQPATGPPLAA